MPTITINFVKGKTELETTGFAGQSCQDASEPFKKALGKETSQELKDEYYLVETTGQGVNNG